MERDGAKHTKTRIKWKETERHPKTIEKKNENFGLCFGK
jgi:hypothetical protein